MNEETQQQRFTSQVAELVGAQAMAALVKEVWANADPSLKAEMATAIVARLQEELAKDTGDRPYDNAISRGAYTAIEAAVTRFAKDEAAKLFDDIKATTARSLVDQYPVVVEKAAKKELEDVCQRVLTEVQQSLKIARRC